MDGLIVLCNFGWRLLNEEHIYLRILNPKNSKPNACIKSEIVRVQKLKNSYITIRFKSKRIVFLRRVAKNHCGTYTSLLDLKFLKCMAHSLK